MGVLCTLAVSHRNDTEFEQPQYEASGVGTKILSADEPYWNF